MRIKKVLQGTALTALAAAAWLGAGTVDASAALAGGEGTKSKVASRNANELSIDVDSDTNISVSTVEQTLTVKTSDKEVLFAVGTYVKENKNAGKKATVKVSAWDVYDVSDYNGDVSIDLSKLNNTKENYLAVKTEKMTNPVYIKVSAAVSSQTAKFNVEQRTVVIDKTKVKILGKEAASNGWEYRTAYGTWIPFDPYVGEASKFDNYQDGDKNEYTKFNAFTSQGASLYIRAIASGCAVQTSSDTVSGAGIVAGVGDLYVTGALPGKETKITIPKQANGPSVAVDYVKSTVSLKKKTEYRVLTKNGESYTIKDEESNTKGITAVGENTTATVGALLGSAKEGVLEVRTSVDASKKGTKQKLVSKWTRVDLSKTDLIAVNAGISKDKVYSVTDGAVAVHGATSGSVYITIAPQPRSATNKAYNKKILVTNKTDKNINVRVGYSSSSNGKVTVVNAGAENKAISADAEKLIEIGIAGDKRNKVWASDYVEIGTVK